MKARFVVLMTIVSLTLLASSAMAHGDKEDDNEKLIYVPFGMIYERHIAGSFWEEHFVQNISSEKFDLVIRITDHSKNGLDGKYRPIAVQVNRHQRMVVIGINIFCAYDKSYVSGETKSDWVGLPWIEVGAICQKVITQFMARVAQIGVAVK